MTDVQGLDVTANSQETLPLIDQFIDQALYYGNQTESAIVKALLVDPSCAIATLLRLELQGVNVGRRWSELAPYLYARLNEHALPFQDLHYIYALARAGYTDWVDELLQSWTVTIHAKQVSRDAQSVWLQIVLPVAKGLIAHARREWSVAALELQPCLEKLHAVGGSRTQRKLFGQIYQHACVQNESNWSAFKAG